VRLADPGWPTRLRRRSRSRERARRPARRSSEPIRGAGPAPRLWPDLLASRWWAHGNMRGGLLALIRPAAV